MPPAYRIAEIENSPGAGPAFDYGFRTAAVRPGFFEAFDRPLVSGRAFQESATSASTPTTRETNGRTCFTPGRRPR